MRYQRIREDKEGISYRVMEQEKLAAEFAYHLEETESPGNKSSRFCLDKLCMAGEPAVYEKLDAILQFLQYKCWKAGCNAVYLRINSRNLFYLEMYKKFGFYIIAEEMREIKKDVYTYEYIMKYPLPKTMEEAYYQYIRRN